MGVTAKKMENTVVEDQAAKATKDLVERAIRNHHTTAAMKKKEA